MPPNSYIDYILNRAVKQISLGSAITVVSIIGTGYGFYYNTKDTLVNHAESINEVKIDVVEIKSALNTNKLNQAVSASRIASIEKMMDRIDSKLDRVLIQTK